MEKIIVAITSWKKRINYVSGVVNTLLTNTLSPDKIVLTLSSDEFINKENDLPKDLVSMLSDKFVILWVKENTKAYKKLIPVINEYPNDIIITVDDDVYYPNDFIENIYNDYLKYKCPISCGYQYWYGKDYPESESHHGAFSLIKKEHVGKYLDILYEFATTDEQMKQLPEYIDCLTTYAVWQNGYRYHSGYQCMHQAKFFMPTDTAVSGYGTKEYINSLSKYHTLVKEFIKNTFK